MAVGLNRVEKEFVLATARDEGIPILLMAGKGEWPTRIRELRPERIALEHAIPLRLLRRWQEYEFRFVYREQAIAFSARLAEAREGNLSVEMPETVYKNLGRRYSRRRGPQEIEVSFGFQGDRIELAFPQTRRFDPVAAPEPSPDFKPEDIRSLVHAFGERAEAVASEHAIVMFKDRKPESQAEKLIVKTGLSFYLPSAMAGIPKVDPYMTPRFITRPAFADWLRDQGMPAELVEEEVLRFEREMRNSGVYSELLVPILFQEYVIGYLSLVNRQEGQPPFDLSILEAFQQFALVLAYSLKINGYFRDAPRRNRDWEAAIIDLSAGGMLFANPSRELSAALLPGSVLDLSLRIGQRRLRTKAMLKRRYQDAELFYYGVELVGMAPEDFRFLFEVLYGRPYTDDDAEGLEGLGLRSAR
jgi:hypothetical protein